MSFDKINDYSNDDTNIQNLQQTANRLLSGHMQLTLTEMDTTTVPAIAAGSVVEVNNSLYYATTEQTISTVDPVTLATVADGTVYVCLVPAEDTSGDSYVYGAFTATAPTWSDSKQGYYGTGSQTNYRYIASAVKATASYTGKDYEYYYNDGKPKYYGGYVLGSANGVSGINYPSLSISTKTFLPNNLTISSGDVYVKDSGIYTVSAVGGASYPSLQTFPTLLFRVDGVTVYTEDATILGISGGNHQVKKTLPMYLKQGALLDFGVSSGVGGVSNLGVEAFIVKVL